MKKKSDYFAINKNADVLIECCNKIEKLSKDIEQLKAGGSIGTDNQ